MRPSLREIREEAYSRWEDRVQNDGFPPDGRALDDWLGAEQDLLFGMNYEILFEDRLDKKLKQFIGSKTHRKCRYCGNVPPASTFKTEAHAISYSLGNRSLIALDECDDCNTVFSNTGEDSLGKMLIPLRALLGMSGRKGPLTVKSKDEKFRFSRDTAKATYVVQDDGPNKVMRHDPATRTLSADLPAQAFIPVRLLKGLAKMALAVMPQEALTGCGRTLEWLRSRDDGLYLDEIRDGMTYISFVPPEMPYPSAGLYKRTDPDSGMPAYCFVILVASLMLQTYVPLCDLDEAYAGKELMLPRLGHTVYNREGPTQWDVIPVKSTEWQKDAVLEVVWQYDEQVESADSAQAEQLQNGTEGRAES